jgi:hypothetical protein
MAELSRQRIDDHAHTISGSARFQQDFRAAFSQVLDRRLQLIALGAQLVQWAAVPLVKASIINVSTLSARKSTIYGTKGMA